MRYADIIVNLMHNSCLRNRRMPIILSVRPCDFRVCVCSCSVSSIYDDDALLSTLSLQMCVSLRSVYEYVRWTVSFLLYFKCEIKYGKSGGTLFDHIQIDFQQSIDLTAIWNIHVMWDVMWDWLSQSLLTISFFVLIRCSQHRLCRIVLANILSTFHSCSHGHGARKSTLILLQFKQLLYLYWFSARI